ncbi:MAG: MFS transporter [Streptosporangiales bacterium]|nr:MFS transporter [Streptosporangiales bacterium]
MPVDYRGGATGDWAIVTRGAAGQEGGGAGGTLHRLAVLWLVGLNLRITVLALPPVLPAVRDAFALSQAALAALTTLPVLLLAAGAPVGSAIIARIGPYRALFLGLLVIASASALRGPLTHGSPGAVMLFTLTFLMGLAIATIQPTLPALVHRWLERSAALGTATYMNGLLVGEMLAASLTLPLVLPLVGVWRGVLVAWSLPAVFAALALLTLRGAAVRSGPVRRGVGPNGRGTGKTGIWPNWRSGSTWRLGLLQGGASVVYFTGNTFLPTYLHATDMPGLVGPSLTALNTAQVPASLLLAVLPTAWVTSPLLAAALGVVTILGLALLLIAAPIPVLAGAAVIGFTSAVLLIIAFTLPVIVAAEDAHRASAGMFTIGYGLAFLLPLLGGSLWDATGQPALAFAPAFLSALWVLVLAPSLRQRARPADASS